MLPSYIAYEWCALAGAHAPSATTLASVAVQRAVTLRAAFIAAIPPPSFGSLESEVDFFLGRIHVLLEVLFPDLRPRPVEHVGHLELDGLAWRHLRRET